MDSSKPSGVSPPPLPRENFPKKADKPGEEAAPEKSLQAEGKAGPFLEPAKPEGRSTPHPADISAHISPLLSPESPPKEGAGIVSPPSELGSGDKPSGPPAEGPPAAKREVPPPPTTPPPVTIPPDPGGGPIKQLVVPPRPEVGPPHLASDPEATTGPSPKLQDLASPPILRATPNEGSKAGPLPGKPGDEASLTPLVPPSEGAPPGAKPPGAASLSPPPKRPSPLVTVILVVVGIGLVIGLLLFLAASCLGPNLGGLCPEDEEINPGDQGLTLPEQSALDNPVLPKPTSS